MSKVIHPNENLENVHKFALKIKHPLRNNNYAWNTEELKITIINEQKQMHLLPILGVVIQAFVV